jgi:hypothetical protein
MKVEAYANASRLRAGVLGVKVDARQGVQRYVLCITG